MFLKNYYRLIGGITTKQDSGSYNKFSLKNYKNTDKYCGTNTYLYQYGFGSFMKTVNKSTSYSGGVSFGSGMTAPTLDDVKLENIITGISVAAVSVTPTEDDDGFGCEGVYTITNTGTDEITISEVSATPAGADGCIIERTVLDNPVSIPAGGVGQVTYTVRMNYPTA